MTNNKLINKRSVTLGLQLSCFFPYQLTQLQAIVSDCIAEIYTGKFDLSRHEWRVLAILGNADALSAKHISQQANLDKMQASRAISKMTIEKLVTKTTNNNDKRSSLLKLTNKGADIYKQLVPMVLARENELLSILNNDELNQLTSTISKLSVQSKLILNDKV